MVRQHEDGGVIRRVVAPPAFPRVVCPGAAHWPEHVSAQYPRPDVRQAACREIIVDARGAVIGSQHLLECARGMRPSVQSDTTHTKRVIDVLAWPSAITVKRNGKCM